MPPLTARPRIVVPRDTKRGDRFVDEVPGAPNRILNGTRCADACDFVAGVARDAPPPEQPATSKLAVAKATAENA